MSILIRFSEAAVPPTQPSTFTRNLLLAGVLASWALTASAPVFATVGLQNGVEIKPPPRSEVTQQLIRSTWEPKEVSVPRRFVPQGTPAVEAGPLQPLRIPDAVLASWQPVPVDIPRRFVPQRAADTTAPLVQPRIADAILASWQPVSVDIPRRFVPQGVEQADNPPPLRQDVIARLILDSWLPPVQPDQGRRFVQPVVEQADNPPPLRQDTATRLLLESWLPPIPAEQGRRYVQPVVPPGDPPPPYVRIPDALYASWNLTESGALWAVTGYQDGPTIAPDNPPPGRRDWLQAVAQSWLPPPQPRQRPVVVTPSGPTPDNPPTGYQPWLALLQEQELRHVRDRELWPRPRPPVVSESGPAIVAVYREIVIRGNDPSGTEDYYEQWFG